MTFALGFAFGLPTAFLVVSNGCMMGAFFALFASKPAELPDSYRRYLVNALRQDFDLPGTPIRMMLRKGKNPYQPR